MSYYYIYIYIETHEFGGGNIIRLNQASGFELSGLVCGGVPRLGGGGQ